MLVVRCASLRGALCGGCMSTTRQSEKNLRRRLLAGCAYGALLTLAAFVAYPDAAEAQHRTVVIGGAAPPAPRDHPETVVIGGGRARTPGPSVAEAPRSRGGVTVDLNALGSGGRATERALGFAGLRPPDAEAFGRRIALRPPSSRRSQPETRFALVPPARPATEAVALRPPTGNRPEPPPTALVELRPPSRPARQAPADGEPGQLAQLPALQVGRPTGASDPDTSAMTRRLNQASLSDAVSRPPAAAVQTARNPDAGPPAVTWERPRAIAVPPPVGPVPSEEPAPPRAEAPPVATPPREGENTSLAEASPADGPPSSPERPRDHWGVPPVAPRLPETPVPARSDGILPTRRVLPPPPRSEVATRVDEASDPALRWQRGEPAPADDRSLASEAASPTDAVPSESEIAWYTPPRPVQDTEPRSSVRGQPAQGPSSASGDSTAELNRDSLARAISGMERGARSRPPAAASHASAAVWRGSSRNATEVAAAPVAPGWSRRSAAVPVVGIDARSTAADGTASAPTSAPSLRAASTDASANGRTIETTALPWRATSRGQASVESVDGHATPEATGTSAQTEAPAAAVAESAGGRAIDTAALPWRTTTVAAVGDVPGQSIDEPATPEAIGMPAPGQAVSPAAALQAQLPPLYRVPTDLGAQRDLAEAPPVTAPAAPSRPPIPPRPEVVPAPAEAAPAAAPAIASPLRPAARPSVPVRPTAPASPLGPADPSDGLSWQRSATEAPAVVPVAPTRPGRPPLIRPGPSLSMAEPAPPPESETAIGGLPWMRAPGAAQDSADTATSPVATALARTPQERSGGWVSSGSVPAPLVAEAPGANREDDWRLASEARVPPPVRRGSETGAVAPRWSDTSVATARAPAPIVARADANNAGTAAPKAEAGKDVAGTPWLGASNRAVQSAADIAAGRGPSQAPVWRRGEPAAAVETAQRRSDTGRGWTMAAATVPPAVEAPSRAASAGSSSDAQRDWSRRAASSNAPPLVAARQPAVPPPAITWNSGGTAPSTAVAATSRTETAEPASSARWSRSAAAPSTVVARAASAPRWTEVAAVQTPVRADLQTDTPRSTRITWSSPDRPAATPTVSTNMAAEAGVASAGRSRSASAPSTVVARASSSPQGGEASAVQAPVRSDLQTDTPRSTRITWLSPDRPDPAPAISTTTGAEAPLAESRARDALAALPPQAREVRPEPATDEGRASAWRGTDTAPPPATIVTASLAEPATASWHRTREAAPAVAASPAAAVSGAAAPAAEARSPLSTAMAEARGRREAAEASTSPAAEWQEPQQVAALATGTTDRPSRTRTAARPEAALPEPRPDEASPIDEPLRLGLSVPSDPPAADTGSMPAERSPEAPAATARDDSSPTGSQEDGAASVPTDAPVTSSSPRIVWNAPPVQVSGQGSPTGTSSSARRIHWNAPRAEPLPELPAAPPAIVQEPSPVTEPEVREVRVASLPWASSGSVAAGEPPQLPTIAASRPPADEAEPPRPAAEQASPASPPAPEPAVAQAPAPPDASPPAPRAEARAPVVPLRVEVARSEDLAPPPRRADKGPPPRVPPRPAPPPAAADEARTTGERSTSPGEEATADAGRGEVQLAALPPSRDAAGNVSIPFGAGEARIPDQAYRELRTVARSLLSNPGLRVQVLAFATPDEEGDATARRTSLSRALAVRSYLIDAGIRSTRIDVRALGDVSDRGPVDRVEVVLSQS